MCLLMKNPEMRQKSNLTSSACPKFWKSAPNLAFASINLWNVIQVNLVSQSHTQPLFTVFPIT